ncbi:MAG: hypothetical protein ACRD3K_08055, partial [Edaphobacter sp.]
RQECTPKHGISWKAERDVAAFCVGALQDARCLRAHLAVKPTPHIAKGSAMQCIRLLMGLVAISYGVALLLPGVSAILHFSPYRDSRNLMLIRDANYSSDAVPTISAAQYQVWKHRRQELFSDFAFYRFVQEPLSAKKHDPFTGKIAIASSNLFNLVGLPIRFASQNTRDDLPRLILSNEL